MGLIHKKAVLHTLKKMKSHAPDGMCQKKRKTALHPLLITHPVASDGGEHQRVSLFAVPVELDPEQRLAVVLLHVTHDTSSVTKLSNIS